MGLAITVQPISEKFNIYHTNRHSHYNELHSYHLNNVCVFYNLLNGLFGITNRL